MSAVREIAERCANAIRTDPFGNNVQALIEAAINEALGNAADGLAKKAATEHSMAVSAREIGNEAMARIHDDREGQLLLASVYVRSPK